MIEMRWKETEVPVAWDIKESFVTKTRIDRVLQYRTGHQYLDADGNIHPMMQGNAYAWSEWIDVPTVREE